MNLKGAEGAIFPDQILRKLYDFEKVCFKRCVDTPGKSLSGDEEKCLATCTAKIFKGIDYLRKRDEKRHAILGSEPDQ